MYNSRLSGQTQKRLPIHLRQTMSSQTKRNQVGELVQKEQIY